MTATTTKSRPAFLIYAGIGSTVRFSTPRVEVHGDIERIVRDEDTLQPVYDVVEGEITTYEVDRTHRPHPIVKFNVKGRDRLFKMSPNFHIEILTEVDNSVTAQLSRLREAAHRVRSGTIDLDGAGDALTAAQQLIEDLKVRAYPMGDHADETLEQVVITVHGVDVSIRGREHDLFVHVDDERDLDEKQKQPLCVEVNDCGEQDYGTPTD